MAAYRWIIVLVTCRLTARGPGSTPEPYARFEYGTTFILPYSRFKATAALPKTSFWGLLTLDILQAGCPSCSPTDIVKALKEESTCIIIIIIVYYTEAVHSSNQTD